MTQTLPAHNAYINVNGRKVHYRRTGDGPPMILQHASPLTSQSLAAAAQIFGHRFTCFALDNPGYGLSDPLPKEDRANLSAYVDALRETIAALGLVKPVIYGASTGGAITHRLGCEYPDEGAILMLDTFSHMDTEETIRGYFPDVTPRRDGAQFLAYWDKLTGLAQFTPWQRSEPDRRQLRDMPPPAVTHNMLMQQLTAGVDYKHLYGAAIEQEDNANVPKLKARATINVWKGKPSYEKVLKSIDDVLTENYIPIYSEPGPNGRYENQLAWLVENGFADAPPATPIKDISADDAFYVDCDLGQIHVRAGGSGSSALLLLHDWGGSAHVFDKIAPGLHASYRTYAPDLPGHGDTSADFSGRENTIDATARALESLISTIDVDHIDILGVGAGVLIGAALKSLLPERIRRLACLASAPVILDTEEVQYIEAAAPDLTPQPGGAHLVLAFDLAKRHRLFWRWYQPTKEFATSRLDAFDPVELHRITVDLLRSDPAWKTLHAASAGWIADNKKAMALLSDSVLFLPRWRIGESGVEDQLAPPFTGERIVLPDHEADWAEKIISTLKTSI